MYNKEVNVSGVSVKIKSHYNNFSETEKKVADYILKNEDKVPYQSVYEIAEALGTSVPSVTRLTKKIGYESFKDFKVELAMDSSSSVVDIYSAITPEDNDEELTKKVFMGNMKALENTLKILNVNDLINAARCICNGKRIVFFGIGGSGIVAGDGALRFSHLDIQAEAYSDPLQIVLQAKRLKKDSVALGVSHSGRTSIIVEALGIAAENKATTVGISNYVNTPLSKASSFYLCTSFAENTVKVAALSSNIAQLCVIDVLYLLVAKYKSRIWDVESLDNLIEKTLRIDK